MGAKLVPVFTATRAAVTFGVAAPMSVATASARQTEANVCPRLVDNFDAC